MTSDQIPTDDLSAVRRAQTAIRQAVARTDLAAESRDSDLVFVGYVETVVWACALDELLERMEPGTYAERRDADPGGRVLRGLRWARNQGVHQLALHENAKGIRFPMTFPVRFDFNPVWRDRSVSPNARRGIDNERAYDAEVAGKPVAYTLTAARNFLFERARPNPFLESLPRDMSWPLSAEDWQKGELPDLPETPSDQQ